MLLKNEGSLLPLKAGEKIAVIGDFARTPRYQGAGSSAVNALQVDALLDCIKADDSGISFVGYASGFDRQGAADPKKQEEAVSLAKKADTVLLCLGLDELRESEGLTAPIWRWPRTSSSFWTQWPPSTRMSSSC